MEETHNLIIKIKVQKIFSILFSFTVESLTYFHNRHFKKSSPLSGYQLLYFIMYYNSWAGAELKVGTPAQENYFSIKKM